MSSTEEQNINKNKNIIHKSTRNGESLPKDECSKFLFYLDEYDDSKLEP